MQSLAQRVMPVKTDCTHQLQRDYQTQGIPCRAASTLGSAVTSCAGAQSSRSGRASRCAGGPMARSEPSLCASSILLGPFAAV